jgi:predicted ATP-grasp superfamily ATP-dependent carboligase
MPTGFEGRFMSRNSDRDVVVIPADHGGSSLACIRSLGRKGIGVIAVAANPDAPAAKSKYCQEVVSAPPVSEDLAGYRDVLLDLARREEVVTIAPLYEADIYVLAKHRDEFAEHIATPWPDFEKVWEAQDRLRLFREADKAGVPTPKTTALAAWDDWNQETAIKSRYTIQVVDGGVTYPGVEFVGADDEPDFPAIIEEMGHVPMVQEFIPGDQEHGFFALFDNGEPVAKFQHRRVRSYTYSGGASVFRKAARIPELEDAGMKMLEALNWHGPAMVEFKRDPRDGEFKLMEVNPRFWGSLPLAVHAGVDFPYLYYRLATDGVPRPSFDYDPGVGCHTLRGEVSYLNSVARYDYDHVEKPPLGASVYGILQSLYDQPNFDYFASDDVQPFVTDMMNTARDYAPKPKL